MNDPGVIGEITRRWFTQGWLGDPSLAEHTFAESLTTNGIHACDGRVNARLA